MHSFKFFLKCCCDSSAAPEENKSEKLPSNLRIEKRSLTPKNELDSTTQEIKLVEEKIIQAAPFPKQENLLYPKLKLRIIESSSIDPNTMITITSTGMEESKRGKSDNKTFIGSVLMENGEIINDFVVDEENQGMGKQHLMIRFSPSNSKYLLSDLEVGTGTFVKIAFEIVLKDGYIISFGNSHMKIISAGYSNEADKKLIIKFIEGPKINEEYCFHPNDENILIGRMADCRIRFEDSNLSRYQSSIFYQEGKGWILKDGVAEKKSTNGTWLYVEEEFEIYDKLVFKAGKTLFEANLE